MKQPLEIPIIFKRVRINGIHASREVDMILDTGAIYTAISWNIAKDIGYDPTLNKPSPREIHASDSGTYFTGVYPARPVPLAPPAAPVPLNEVPI